MNTSSLFRIILSALVLLKSNPFYAQDCESITVTFDYPNGSVKLNVCENNPSIDFDETKVYYWFNDRFGVKSSKGYSGGLLLNGELLFYDLNGDLRQKESYNNGLKHGEILYWDSTGTITQKRIYEYGNQIYTKIQTEDGFWIETIGELLSEGYTKNVFTKYGTLLEEITYLNLFKKHVKIYYEYPKGQLKSEYTVSETKMLDYNVKYFYGDFIEYYSNGKVKLEGKFYDGELLVNLKDGVWIWYDIDGKILKKENYKIEIVHWENGNEKSIEGFILIDDDWVKHGECRYYDELESIPTIVDYVECEKI
jgi:antitoxin component YwqK of YwqJK toxin-antitoxin module